MSSLLIVESPAKAKTIEKYLGAGWRVISSVGHIRDLVPEDGSVDVDNNFAMKWAVMSGKEKAIKQILDEVKKADTVYLATDQDREGEAIAWHILSILDDKKVLVGKKVFRITFNEITKSAVMDAVENPREIDNALVDAYLVRRALDYLIGFKLSPVLWRKNMGKSAGRVQSVAVALVVDREREIMVFNPVEYWSLSAKAGIRDQVSETSFISKLTQLNGKKIDKMALENEVQIIDTLSTITGQQLSLIPDTWPLIPASVASVEKKKSSRKPAAPFTTSTLQQEAARKMGFSAKRTGMAAQRLYEAGHITYIRTDSTTIATDAVDSIREFIGNKYGNAFLPAAAIKYATKSKNAQEAHEAIRPVDVGVVSAPVEDDDQKRLYDLIWKRTVACQMTNAEFDSVVVDIKPDNADAIFHAVGTTRTFDGFMKVYVEDEDDKESDDGENKLPPLSVGDAIDITELLPKQHFTAPPPRYGEASLIKKMEELGIGRPSTYASIMSTIIDRAYVSLDQKRFTPTATGWLLSAYLSKYFGNIVDVNFTANMEDIMDEVAGGKVEKLGALGNFWGAFEPTLSAARDVKNPDVMEEVNKSLAGTLVPADAKCAECDGKMTLRVSRYGPFLSCEKYPDCKYIQRIDGNGASDTNTGAGTNTKDLGEGITYKVGRFGPYVTDGTKNASAKKYSFEEITLDIARELLSGEKKKVEAIELGLNPATGKPILYYADGRYGAYISSNKVNVSVKEQPDLEVAAELINNKKPSAKKAWGRKK